MNLPEFSAYQTARLLSAEPAASEQAWLEVEAPDGFGAAHRYAGQFCRIRINGAAGIFAMATAPGRAPVRFLVRIGAPIAGEAADQLASLAPGTAIEMSLPAGAGFQVPDDPSLPLVFVATGTGVAPVCASIEAVLEAGHRAPLTLVHGVRSDGHVAIRDHLKRWRAAGVQVRVCFSELDATGALVGESVQSGLEAVCPDLSGSALVAVGQPEMLVSLLEAARALGLQPERFLTNI